MYGQTPVERKIERLVTNGLGYISPALVESKAIRGFVENLHGGSSSADLQLHLAELEIRSHKPLTEVFERRASTPLIADLPRYDEAIKSVQEEFNAKVDSLKRKHRRG